MTKIISLCQQIASEIFSIENRERKRFADAQKHFEHAIECLLKELWLGTAIHPEYEVGIHRRSNWYSETPLLPPEHFGGLPCAADQSSDYTSNQHEDTYTVLLD